jgi:hypothetical protein
LLKESLLIGVICKILGLEATNRDNIDVCIAFMLRISGKVFTLSNETYQSD